ncbi:hypothetical protein [Paenibacillus terrigena]|uniref:hypothetical protein n=1 Tax=Paenibacillus terrigena TaxID=369333 RepID=UPI00037709E6|nr:hypothetical protein [Paenibacillus terrigena]
MEQVTVFSYTHPDDPVISDICDRDQVLHICATTSLTQAMTARDGGKRKNIISAKWFTDAVLGDWMDSYVKLEQYIHLSELLRKGSPDNPDDTPMKKSFRKNKQGVLLAIRTLAELGLKPQDLEAYAFTANEKELAVIWAKMLKQDEGANHFKKLGQVMFAYRHPAAFKMMTAARLKEKYEKDLELESSLAVSEENLHLDGEVILHGFYFLTPLQQQMFQSLRQAGVKITFLQYYHPDFPHTFRFLEEVLGTANDWVPAEDWKVSLFTQEAPASRYFAGLFENKKESAPPVWTDQISIQSYRNVHQWINDFGNTEIQTYHLTPNYNDLEARLKEFFPERFQEERNFLSYPVGQYLLHLHKMWDQERKQQLVSIEMLTECFVSPWLSVVNPRTGKKQPASDYVHILYTLKDFFPRKMSLEAWRTGIAKLIDQIENGEFLVRGIEASPEHYRFVDEIRNPIKKIAPYAVPPEDLAGILTILDNISAHVQLFFKDMNKGLTLFDYFQLILKFIYKQQSEVKFLEHEEKLVDKIWEFADASQSHPKDKKYQIEDISEALHALLAAHLEEEGALPLAKTSELHDLAEIDGIIFHEGAAHVTGLDEFSFPNAASTLTWPLTKQTIEKLSERVPAMKAAVLRENHKDAIPRYLFNILLSRRQQVTLSWFMDWKEQHALEPSIYLKLLIDQMPQVNDHRLLPSMPASKAQTLTGKTKDFNRVFEHYSDYALSEIHMCPRRFFSSYLLRPYSVYHSEFHYSFLYQNLYAVLAHFTDMPGVVLHDVFPHWTSFKHLSKGMMANRHALSPRAFKSYVYAGLEYHCLTGMKYLANPAGSSAGWKKAWSNSGYKLTQTASDFTLTRPSSNCKYCPHLNVCPDGRHAVDDEQYAN